MLNLKGKSFEECFELKLKLQQDYIDVEDKNQLGMIHTKQNDKILYKRHIMGLMNSVHRHMAEEYGYNVGIYNLGKGR